MFPVQIEPRDYEFDNMSRDQLVGDKYQDGPPDYYAAVLQKTFADDSLPDYEDDMVRKVIVWLLTRYFLTKVEYILVFFIMVVYHDIFKKKFWILLKFKWDNFPKDRSYRQKQTH